MTVGLQHYLIKLSGSHLMLDGDDDCDGDGDGCDNAGDGCDNAGDGCDDGDRIVKHVHVLHA